MRTYANPATDDPKLLAWYRTLLETGDLKALFRVEQWPLSAFLAGLQPPRTLCFEETAEGAIWFAAWTSPLAVGVCAIDLWVAEPMRHTKAALRAVVKVLTSIFEYHHLVLAMTSNEQIADEHQHFGFTRLGVIPQMVDGEDTVLSYLPRADFAAIHQRLQPQLSEVH